MYTNARGTVGYTHVPGIRENENVCPGVPLQAYRFTPTV